MFPTNSSRALATLKEARARKTDSQNICPKDLLRPLHLQVISKGSVGYLHRTTFSTSTGVYQVHRLTTMTDHQRGRRRPDRVQLACLPCKQGKLKCNRAFPACDQVLNNLHTFCVWRNMEFDARTADVE